MQVPWNKGVKGYSLRPKIYPNLTPSKSRAYILGVLFGDGFLIRYKHARSIRLRTTDREFAESFAEHLQLIGLNAKVYRFNNGRYSPVYVTQATSKVFYEWCKSLSLNEIEEIASLYPEDFIRGFYESEGWCKVTKEGKRVNYGKRFYTWERWRLQMYNSKISLLELVKILSEKLGFRTNLHGKGNKYTLSIEGKQQVTEFLLRIKPCIKGGI